MTDPMQNPHYRDIDREAAVNVHRLRFCPEDDRVLAARQVWHDRCGASDHALANAAMMLRHLGNDASDQVKATDLERIVIARHTARRAAEAAAVPFGWAERPKAPAWLGVALCAAVAVWAGIGAVAVERWWTAANRAAVEGE